MDEFYRPKENISFSEDNVIREYNSSEEKYNSAEMAGNRELNGGDAAKEKKTSASTSSRRRATLFGGLVYTVGAVGGGAVITAAVLMVVINIAILSEMVTSYSVNLFVSLENNSDHTFTAMLYNQDESYSYELEGNVGEQKIYFGFLLPDTAYTLDIVDDEGELHFSKNYRTMPYEQKLFPVENGVSGASYLIQFEPQDFLGYPAEVYIDDELCGTLSTENSFFRSENLSAYSDYTIKIIASYSGEWLYYSHFTTEASLDYYINYINACGASLTFYDYGIPEQGAQIYVDGTQAGSVSVASPTIVFDGLDGSASHEIEARDLSDGGLLMKGTLEMPSVGCNISDFEVYPSYVTFGCTFYGDVNSTEIRLFSAYGLVNTYTEIMPSYTFSDLEPNTEYELIIYPDGLGYPLYIRRFVTTSYFDVVTAAQSVEEDGRVIYELDRIDDDGADVNYVNFMLPDTTSLSEVVLECGSEDGLVVPIKYEGSSRSLIGPYVCSIYTQYARGGEVYELSLYTMSSEGKMLLESIYFRVNDEKYTPTFNVGLNYPVDGSAATLYVRYLGGELPADSNGAVYYIMGTIIEGAFSQDFTLVPEQSFAYIGTSSAPDTITIRMITDYGEYVLFSAEIQPETVEVI